MLKPCLFGSRICALLTLQKTLTYWQFDNILNITMAFSCYLQRRKFRFFAFSLYPYGFIKIMNITYRKVFKENFNILSKNKRWIFIEILHLWGFPGRVSGKESTYPCRRHKRLWFCPWVRKIPGGGNSKNSSILALRILWT